MFTKNQSAKLCHTAISIKVVGLTQAYATRLKGSVGSFTVVRIVGHELRIS